MGPRQDQNGTSLLISTKQAMAIMLLAHKHALVGLKIQALGLETHGRHVTGQPY